MTRVRLFAVLREIAGESFVEADGRSVERVVQALCDRYGERFTEVVKASSVVVDGERVSLDRELLGSEEVAILPPVSGGAAKRPKRVLLVVNPRARSVSDSTVDVIEKALSADFKLDVAETVRRGHGAEAAREAVDAGYQMIVVFSGDGTINEVVNGIVGTDVALGIIPGGATNVFARILGVPLDPVDATGVLIRLALGARARRVHVGSANGRYFVINCGAGLDAAVMARVEERSPRSKLSHEREALFAALKATNEYIGKQPALTVRIDDGLELAAVSVLIGKLNPYAYFKNWGLRLHPRASLEGGLDVLAVQRLPRLAVPKVVYQMFVSGDVASNRNMEYAHDVSHVEIAGGKPFPVQVDGDYVGEHDALDVQLVRDALWVVA